MTTGGHSAVITLPSHDILATIVDQASYSEGHKALIEALAKRGMDGVKYMQMRDGLENKVSIYDAGRNRLGDYRGWLASEITRAGGSADAVYRKYKDSGYQIGTAHGAILYFCLPYGDKPGEFFQFSIRCERETIDCGLFGTSWTAPQDLDDLMSHTGWTLDEPIEVSGYRYTFEHVHNIRRLAEDNNALFKADLAANGERLAELTDRSTGSKTVARLADMQPRTFDTSKRDCPAYRMLVDWEQSSAGQSGAALHDHWYFHVWDGHSGTKRSISLIPGWTTTKKLAEVEAKPRDITDHAIFDKLIRLDKRVGVPFAWYFFMLHGNRVHDWAGIRILKAVEDGILILPDRDYLVLRRWHDDRYGF